jgi:hypothetical protein
LARREPEMVFTVEAKKEINPSIAEGALAVENHYRVPAGIHAIIVSALTCCMPGAKTYRGSYYDLRYYLPGEAHQIWV